MNQQEFQKLTGGCGGAISQAGALTDKQGDALLNAPGDFFVSVKDTVVSSPLQVGFLTGLGVLATWLIVRKS